MRTIGRFDDDDDDDDDVETGAKCPSRLCGILFLPTGIFATGNIPKICKIQSRNCEQCSKIGKVSFARKTCSTFHQKRKKCQRYLN